MAESFKDRISSFGRHIRRHTKKLISKEEQGSEAFSGMAKETGRFVKHIVKPGASRNRKQAVSLVNKGKDAYNGAEYLKAVKYFKRAIAEDESYARAWMYLGNTYYKQDMNVDAGRAWSKAIEAEPKSSAADKARDKIKKTGHGQVDVLYTQKHSIKKD